jgi:SAM-dependent methyltransferase
MSTSPSIGTDHCRVTKPEDEGSTTAPFEYFRHLFPYAEVARRTAPTARLLEVGCGSGYGANLLAGTLQDVTATDAYEQAITYARSRYPRLRFVQASGTMLPFAPCSFDVVVSFQVVEHIDNAAGYLRELHRVVRPGATLYLTTPNRRLRLFPLQRPWNPYHVREYTDHQIGKLLASWFGTIEQWGIMARQDLMDRETTRVNRNRLLQPFQPIASRVRRLLFSSRTGQEAAFASSAATSGPPVDPVPCTLGDFFLSPDTRHCLDLFCRARRIEESHVPDGGQR